MGGNVANYRTLIEALEGAPADREFVTHWVDEDEREAVTFGEFRRRARAQACALHQHGVGAGDRVIVIMPQSIAALSVFVGAMMLGAVPAFLAYPNFKVEPAKYLTGLRGVTANLDARIVVIDQAFPDDLLGHIALGDGARLLRMNGAGAENGPLPGISIRSDDLAFVQHSAGTTGLQKGVPLTHAAVLRQIEHLRDALQIRDTADRIYNWLPLYHDMGLIACFVLPMVCHVPVVMQSPLEWVMQPESMLQIVGACRCTLAWMPNFAFQFVPRRVPSDRWAQYDLSSIRALINCSEPVRANSLREFEIAFRPIGLKQGALQSSYAMAENVFAVSQTAGVPTVLWADAQAFRQERRVRILPPETPGAMAFTSSGRLLPGTEVRIVDDQGRLLSPGTVGEIQIKGDCLFTGYFNRPDLTELAMIDGWYRSGDLGFDLAGELYVVGRKKDLLIVGGENLYPQDIEEVVATHPAIHDGRTIALGLYNPDLGTEEVVIVAEVEREQSLADGIALEREIRALVIAATGIAVRRIILKPPRWIVKSTAGKPARSATREKLLSEHPEFNGEGSA